jgi:hypothetical protein
MREVADEDVAEAFAANLRRQRKLGGPIAG